MNWPKPWRLIDDHFQKYIGGELTWELSHFPDHPLANRTFVVVAMMDAYDNAIIEFDDGTYGYVHLSWNAQSPHFEPIGNETELIRFLETGSTSLGAKMPDPFPLEPATGIQPKPDRRKHIPEPLPVRLVAIEDVHLPAAAGKERELDEFYVGLLGLARAPDREGFLVYHADNVDLIFDVQEPPVDRNKLTPTPFDVDKIDEIVQRLLEQQIPYERMRGVMPGHEYIVLIDPAGNWVSLMQRRIVG